MNKISFLDELLKLGAMRKIADEVISDTPQGMRDSSAPPPADVQNPAEVSTRLPNSSKKEGVIEAGTLGEVTDAKDPIDQHRFNRPWRNWG